VNKTEEIVILTELEELGSKADGMSEAVYIESDQYPAFVLKELAGGADLKAVYKVSESIKHRWTAVNSCGDRVSEEVNLAFRNWVAAVTAARPGETFVNAGHDRPAISLRYRHPIGGKRKCSGTAYIPCWAEFSK
jgi:hypothetical protein